MDNYHYFIGKMINNEESHQLNGSQNYLLKQMNNLGVAPSGKIQVKQFHTKFAYLGYTNKETELEVKDKLNNVFEALRNKFAPVQATYTGYNITGIKTKKSISLMYTCDLVSEIIVPYIRSYTEDMRYYPEEKNEPSFNPHVALIRFDAKDQNTLLKPDDSGKNLLQKVFLPKDPHFMIDSIDLLCGKPRITRPGTPSKYDDMDIEVVHRYTFIGNLSS